MNASLQLAASKMYRLGAENSSPHGARPTSRRLASALTFCLLTLALPGLAWNSVTPLPDGYLNHSLVYASGYLYNVGGSSASNGDADGVNVFYGPVNSDGTIGSWASTTPLPEAVLNNGCVTARGFVYVLGGYHYTDANGDVVSDIVYYSKINANGSLGSWQTANPLPDKLIFLSASVWNNTIYVIGGQNANYQLQNTVYSAQIQADGSLSAWVTQTPLPATIYYHASVANGFLYVLGGADASFTVQSNVFYTKINTDGTLAGWSQTVSLPQPLFSASAVTAAGQIFEIGGDTGGGPLDTFYNAGVSGNGLLNSWSVGPALPQSLENFGAAVSDSYIFVSGGLSPNGIESAVYSMSLTAPATPVLATRSFTNGNFQLQLTSNTNTGFGLLASTNLTAWVKIGSGFTDTNGTLLFQDTNSTQFPKRFYRAYWPLP